MLIRKNPRVEQTNISIIRLSTNGIYNKVRYFLLRWNRLSECAMLVCYHNSCLQKVKIIYQLWKMIECNLSSNSALKCQKSLPIITESMQRLTITDNHQNFGACTFGFYAFLYRYITQI